MGVGSAGSRCHGAKQKGPSGETPWGLWGPVAGAQDSKGSCPEGASVGPGGGVGSRPHSLAAAFGGPSVTAMTASQVRPSDSGTHRSGRAQRVIPDC